MQGIAAACNSQEYPRRFGAVRLPESPWLEAKDAVH